MAIIANHGKSPPSTHHSSFVIDRTMDTIRGPTKISTSKSSTTGFADNETQITTPTGATAAPANENVTVATTLPQLIALITTEAARGESSVNLSQRDLTELPPEIALLTSKERLGLSSNRLTNLPFEFKSLRKLRYLNLKSNQLREVPQILCEMEHLEILDISRNKIRRLPTSFGKLMNLRVLSVARNRLVELPKYIGDMRELKVLKLEYNPIEWPPPDVVHANSDISTDAWLKNLKDYLLREGDRRSAMRRLPSREILSTENRLESELGANWKECDTLCDLYFNGRPPLKEVTSRGDRVLDICRTVAFATAQLYRVVRQMVTNASDRTIAEKEAIALNRQSRRLIALLMETEEQTSKSGKAGDEEPHTRLKAVAAMAATEARRLVVEVTKHLPVLLVNRDPRQLRSMLVSWYSVTLEVGEALQAATELAIASPVVMSAPHLGLRMGGSSSSPPPSRRSKEIGSVGTSLLSLDSTTALTPSPATLSVSNAYNTTVAAIDSTFLSMADSAAKATSQILVMLRDIPERLSVTALTGRGGSTPSSPSNTPSNFVSEGDAVDGVSSVNAGGKKSLSGPDGDMSALIKKASDVTASLVQTINEAVKQQNPMLQTRVYADVDNFVKTVVQVSVGARDMAKRYPLSSQVRDGLQQVTRSTRELAAHLSRTGAAGGIGGAGTGSSITNESGPLT
ncbi:hypothetical protein SmJEL517_g03373 [Synchytrium microbalum]|uniref:Disease resistance R13L4/SHOC-2-like LRR domain-containing protein n=1 Tax=Synchytrium microbalum TaxID=1806994 RepID=A0A507C797_9FUNG|nr:uncharacterized protein SmJEL517_g03373 [Synchytrium microbalum]TPX33866.1 hypothetical protein SmJEL517_g03373 [Synchytrium microbalum]